MSRFFWIRHGPTHARTMVGWSDLPADLSDSARLSRLSLALPRDAIVISSDLLRASATADAIAAGRDRLPHDPDLREIHFGEWELARFDEVEDQARLRAYWDNPGDISPPGGESWHEVSARVDRAVARLMADHPGRDIVAVAHFGVILTQLQKALRIGAYEAFSHRIDNLSLTELHHVENAWHAQRINFLP